MRAIAKECVQDAVKAAYDAAETGGEDAMVIAFGSLYYLKEVKCALYEIERNRSSYGRENTQ